MKDEGGTIGDAFRFMTEIGIIAQLSGNAMEKALPDGMTMAQFGVLNHLARLGGAWSPLRLANAMQVTKGAMTHTIRYLSAKGHVAVGPDARDGRGKLVSITPKGLAARDAAVAAMAPEIEALVKAVSPELIAQTIPALEKVRRYLDERRAR